MNQKYINGFILMMMALLIGVTYYFREVIVERTEQLKNHELYQSEEYAKKIAEYLVEKSKLKDLEKQLENNPSAQKELSHFLSTFLTKEYQYIFVVQKDSRGYFRFLLDGSLEDKADFHELFFPNSQTFERVWREKKVALSSDSEGVEKVWRSLLYPIVREGKIEGILVLDFSKEYGRYLESFNAPLISFVWWVRLFLMVGLVLLSFLLYRYYMARKQLLIDRLTTAYTKPYLETFLNTHHLNEYHAILLDIDDFKQLNRKYGYSTGDTLLSEFVALLKRELEGYHAKIIRTSGAEFLILLPQSAGEIEVIAKKLFSRVQEKRYFIENETIALTISMSAIEVPEKSPSMQNILRLLDEKLLEIKQKGKNNVAILGVRDASEVIYSNLDYIKEALEEERLVCLYQPIVHTKTKKIVKFEALVRLVDKEDENKLISPFFFMDVIKGTTQYVKMSRLVLSKVFETLKKYPEVNLSFNVDLTDLYNPEMMEVILSYLKAEKESAKRLTFEILEDQEIQDYDRVNMIFSQLRNFGSKVAIDDFGSGFANYHYLIFLNVDILKIDGSIIKELENQPQRVKTILRSIREVVTSFEYELVAEFISSETIYDAMVELDIEYTQGYYLGEPNPIESYLD